MQEKVMEKRYRENPRAKLDICNDNVLTRRRYYSCLKIEF